MDEVPDEVLAHILKALMSIDVRAYIVSAPEVHPRWARICYGTIALEIPHNSSALLCHDVLDAMPKFRRFRSLRFPASVWGSHIIGVLRAVRANDCHELNIADCQVDDEELFMIAQMCPGLKILDVAYCEGGGGDTCADLVAACPSLVELRLDSCCPSVHGLFGATGIWSSLRACHVWPSLRTLYLENCYELTDDGLEIVAKACPGLVNLRLRECNITDASMVTLTRLRSLARVCLCECAALTDSGLAGLVRARPTLKALDDHLDCRAPLWRGRMFPIAFSVQESWI